MAGDKFDTAIMKYVKTKYKLLIGERTAEDIKIAIGTVHPSGRRAEMDIRGRDMVSGLPKTLSISADEVQDALRDPVSAIVAAPSLYWSRPHRNCQLILLTVVLF